MPHLIEDPWFASLDPSAQALVTDLEDEIKTLRTQLAATREDRNRFSDLVFEQAAELRDREHYIEAIRAQVRFACRDLGDNDWPDDLHLGDAIEKHLARPARERLRGLGVDV